MFVAINNIGGIVLTTRDKADAQKMEKMGHKIMTVLTDDIGFAESAAKVAYHRAEANVKWVTYH